MSNYTLQVNVDGAVENEWHGLSIRHVGNVLNVDGRMTLHQIEEFLTDLMTETEAALSVWQSTTNTMFYGHREY